MGDFHPPVEEYLETILELEESGVPAMRARLVERLGVSAPAVSETVARLEREGYLHLDEARVIRLSDSGRDYATAVMRRHRLAERLLTDVLGVPWAEVHEEACRLEHAISPRLEAYLVERLGDPGTCPHGNPIPGSAHPAKDEQLTALADVRAGGAAVIRRIDEELEAHPDHMHMLESNHLLPGQELQVSGVSASGVTVTVNGAEVSVTDAVAAKVYVAA
ncbi:MAG TPA: metal-dependent transcriptional regulator [Mycobacteriales bacterium]|nr:metal-dependent transcriptional regulator [Mycobacteriales bacterium]